MKKGFILLLLCLSLFGCRKSIVSIDGSIDKTLCEKVNEQYNSLPDSLKKECKSIVLCDLDSFEINDEVSIPLSEVHAICYRSPHNPLKKSIFFKS